MSKIGGYQIIDFGGVDLDQINSQTEVDLKTSTKGLLSRKRAVLSGLIYGGYKLNDVVAELQHQDTTNLTTSIFGYTITFTTTANRCTIAKESDDIGGGGGILTVKLDNANTSGTEQEMDKTFDEIVAAIEAGQGVQLIYKFPRTSADVYMLDSFGRESYDGDINFVAFTKPKIGESGVYIDVWQIASDGTITHIRSDDSEQPVPGDGGGTTE